MSELSDKYYSKHELLSIAKEIKIPEKYTEDFIIYIENEIQIMTDDGDMVHGEIQKAAINFAKEYFEKYEIEIQKGHGKKWANLYADSIEEHHHAFNDSYLAVKEIDPILAKQELIIHCKAEAGDELYTSRFIEIMERDGASDEADKQARTFSNIYKKNIADGKSEAYASKYALLKSSHIYSEAYCFWYAKTYDECIQKGKDEMYADEYGEKIGDHVANHGRQSSNTEVDDEDDSYHKIRITGYMKGWEYAVKNQIQNITKFAIDYENVYLNTFFSNDIDFVSENEVLDKIVLEKVLRKNHI